MKTSRYSDPLILLILRQAEGGVPVAELCREHGMSNASFYKWRAKFGGMVECVPAGGQNQAAVLTVCRAYWSSNCAGLR